MSRYHWSENVAASIAGMEAWLAEMEGLVQRAREDGQHVAATDLRAAMRLMTELLDDARQAQREGAALDGTSPPSESST